METEIKNVRLSVCCSEDWRGFKVISERSRFCGTCRHEVVDFTNATQEEFDHALKSGKKVCGRFKTSQMNDSFLKLAAASLLIASSVSCNDRERTIPQEVTKREKQSW
jgi:hypothetical protein